MKDWKAFETRRDERLARSLAKVFDVPYIALEKQYISGGIRAKLPRAVAQSERWVPLVYNSRRIVLVTDDYFMTASSDSNRVRKKLGLEDENRKVQFALTSSFAMDRYLDEHYSFSSDSE